MTITPAQLKQTVSELARQHPDAKRECSYLDQDMQPHCIMGCALYKLGVPIATLEDEEGYGIGDVLDHLGIEVDPDHDAWFANVQSYQDAGDSWGLALARVNGTVTAVAR